MSYFMTIAGHVAKDCFPELEFLPISKGQKYVADLAPALSARDGIPLWFVHDRVSGTSHGLVNGAHNYFSEHGTLDGTLLLRLVEACVATDCGLRVWWASNEPSCYRQLEDFTTTAEFRSRVARMVSEGKDIGVRRKRTGQPDAAGNAASPRASA